MRQCEIEACYELLAQSLTVTGLEEAPPLGMVCCDGIWGVLISKCPPAGGLTSPLRPTLVRDAY